MFEKSLTLLKSRGVEILDIVDCVAFLQKGYTSELNYELIEEYVLKVIEKEKYNMPLLLALNLIC